MNRVTLRRYIISILAVTFAEGAVLYGLSRGGRTPVPPAPSAPMDIVLFDMSRSLWEDAPPTPQSGREISEWRPRAVAQTDPASETVTGFESPEAYPAAPPVIGPWSVRRGSTPDYMASEAIQCVSGGRRWNSARLACEVRTTPVLRGEIATAMPRGRRAEWDEIIRQRGLPPEEPMVPCPKDGPGGNFGVACLPTRD